MNILGNVNRDVRWEKILPKTNKLIFRMNRLNIKKILKSRMKDWEIQPKNDTKL